jgi:hypothetical protein
VRRKTARDLLYSKLGGGNDRDDAFAIPIFLRPTQLQLTLLLPYRQPATREAREAEPCRLQDRRNGGTDDILAVIGKISVAGGEKAGESAPLVAAESYLEHDRGLRKPDFRDLYFGVGLAMAAQFSHALLRLIAKDQDFLVLSLPQHGPGNRSPLQGRCPDAYGVARPSEYYPVKGHLSAGLRRNQIAADGIAFGDSILLAARLNDRVHNPGTIANLDAGLKAW